MTSKISFDGESAAYRDLRNQLLDAEFALTEQIETVAALRRQLPPARTIDTGYVFREGPHDLARNEPSDFFDTRLGDLFEDGKDHLIVAHIMFNPAHETACPLCCMWADGYSAVAAHVHRRANFVLVAKAEIARFRAVAAQRGWKGARLLSSYDNTFNRDFRVETEDGNQMPGVSVLSRDGDGTIHHMYTSEAILHRERGVDLLSPVWNLFDLTPAGRGDWYPSLSYAD